MKISIVIPVFNSSKYLEECINSIANQSYKDFEIVLVNDGSTDGSGEICDRLASMDHRIKVIHKENGGTCDARNVGMKACTGKYITFMDNDDYWKTDTCLEHVVNQLDESKADVLFFDSVIYWEDKSRFDTVNNLCKRNEILYKEKVDALRVLMEKGLLYRAVWTKVVKASLIKKHSLYFIKGIRNEDTEWTAHLLMVANTFDWNEDAFYIYRKGHGTAQTSKPETYTTILDLKNIIEDYVEKANILDLAERKVIYSFLSYPYAVWLGQSGLIHNQEITVDRKAMKKYDFLIKDSFDPTVQLINKVYRILGYNVTSKLLTFYLKYKYNSGL